MYTRPDQPVPPRTTPIADEVHRWIQAGQPPTPTPRDRAVQIRDVVAKALADWQLDLDPEDVIAAVGELVANAVQHAGEVLGATVLHVPGTLVVAVDDPRPELVPEPRAATLDELPEDAECGRGLPLIHAFGARWAHGRLTGSKRVWVSWPTGCPLAYQPRALRWAPALRR